MKYSAHLQGQKISVLDSDLTLYQNGKYGVKFLTEDCIFLARIGNPKAQTFEHVWSFDFFGDYDMMMEKKHTSGTIHYQYDGKWKEIARCDGYQKVTDTNAIITMGDMEYLCYVPTEKALTVSCDKIVKEEYLGETIFLLKHSLFYDLPYSHIYYLEYYVDIYGNVISQRFNTFRREFTNFSEEKLYSNLEHMKMDCLHSIEQEKEYLRDTICLVKKM